MKHRILCALLIALLACALAAPAMAEIALTPDNFQYCFNVCAGVEWDDTYTRCSSLFKMNGAPAYSDAGTGKTVYKSVDNRTVYIFQADASGVCETIEIVMDLTDNSPSKNFPAYCAMLALSSQWLETQDFADMLGWYSDSTGNSDYHTTTIGRFTLETVSISNCTSFLRLTVNS